MKKHLLAATLALSTCSSFGAGYQVNLEGLRQMAMGGTGTAWPWDASTIFYNPGGLARLKTLEVYGSVTDIMPVTAYGNTQESTRSKTQTFTPFNVYFGGTVKNGGRLALGIGIYTPDGMGLNWGNSWVGRYMVESINMSTIFVQPTISYRVTNLLSIGGGFIYASGKLAISQALPVQDLAGNDGQANLKGQGNGVGFNLGMQFKVNEHLQIGLTYRSQVNMDIGGGAATFNVPASLGSTFPNTQFSTAIPMPQVASIGVGLKPLANERLTLEMDLNLTGWSTFDSLRINFLQHTSMLQNQHTPRLYRNTLSARFGGNYKISKVVSIMGGFSYDPTPVVTGTVTPDLPDADHYNFSCGVSVKPIKRLTIMAACEFTTTPKHTGTYDYANFTGNYQTQAITPGIGAYFNL